MAVAEAATKLVLGRWRVFVGSDQREGSTDPFYSRQGAIDLLIGMVRRDGEANPTGGGRDGRRTNGGRIDALYEEGLREVHGSIGVTDDHRQNGTFRCCESEPESSEPLCQAFTILPQAGAPLRFLLDNLDGSGRCSRSGRRRSGRIHKGAAGVDQV